MDLTIEFLTSHGMVTTSVVPIRYLWLGFILVSQSKILASVQLLFLKSVSSFYSSNLCPRPRKNQFYLSKPLLRSIQSHLPIHNWSAAEVASARHIFLMRRLIAPTLELDPARPKSNNEQLPANQYFDSKSSCLAPRELICTQRSIF